MGNSSVVFGVMQNVNGMVKLAEEGVDVVVYEPNADALMEAVTKLMTENQDKVEFVEINDAEVAAGAQNETVFIKIKNGSVKFINDTQANSEKYE